MNRDDPMVVQHAVLPGRVGKDRRLYLRSDSEIGDWPLHLGPGGSVDLSTYFNLLPYGKLLRYTGCSGFALRIECEGSLRIELAHHRSVGNESVSEAIETTDLDGPRTVHTIPFSCGPEGMVGFRISASEGGCVVYGASFVADVPERRESKMELVICTYRKEDYARKTVGRVLDQLNSIGGSYAESLSITVIDNGNTLELPSDPRLRIIPNRNLGGSGGYARGMMEVREDTTHVVLMDDDAEMDPESLYRIWVFCSTMRPEFSEAFIGGAMLRTDKPTVIHESSGFMGKTFSVSNDHDTDVSELSGCLSSDTEKEANFNAWWLCAIPVSVIRRGGLSMPFFFVYDDVEFGVRHPESSIISINGVAVWHPPFESKCGSSRHYYIARNHMIMHSLTGGACLRNALTILWSAVRSTFCYRYLDADLTLRGFGDYLRGPDWLSDCDAEALNSELVGCTYEFKDLGDVPQPASEDKKNLAKYIGRAIVVNGALLPSKKDRVVVTIYEPDLSAVFRAGEVANIDPFTGRGYITKRSTRESLRCMMSVATMLIRFTVRRRRLDRDYAEKADSLSSESGWKKRLDI